MAKIAGDPDSATNQWFVNLADNTSLDTDNGGFTVFGNVLGEGMQILDAIDNLPVVALGAKASSAPFFTESYGSNPENFVYVNIEVMSRFTSAPHAFELASGLLLTSVNINEGEELISLNFNVSSESPELVIKANMESIIPRRDTFDGIATYSSADQKLRIPTLEVNNHGVVSLVNNVVFARSSSDPEAFVLESYDQ